MFDEHSFSIGRVDNLVFIDELIALLRSTMDQVTCTFCHKVFPNHVVLKRHMRKKRHFKIDADDARFDRFYVINYADPDRDWWLQSERAGRANNDGSGGEDSPDEGSGGDEAAAGAAGAAAAAGLPEREDKHGEVSHRLDKGKAKAPEPTHAQSVHPFDHLNQHHSSHNHRDSPQSHRRPGSVFSSSSVRSRSYSRCSSSLGESIEARSQQSDSWGSDAAEEEVASPCIWCPAVVSTAGLLLKHLSDEHAFDLARMRAGRALLFYDCVRLVNYARHCASELRCPRCDERFDSSDGLQTHLRNNDDHGAPDANSSLWMRTRDRESGQGSSEEIEAERTRWLIPVLPGDPLLAAIEPDDDEDDDDAK